MGALSDHMRSFHDWHARLSASRISASPSRRFSADRSAKMRVIARDFESSFLRALRSPPDSGPGLKRKHARSANDYRLPPLAPNGPRATPASTSALQK